MRAEIKIDKNTKIKINVNNNWLFIYREYFGNDILPDIVPMIDTIMSTLGNLMIGEDIDVDAIEDKMYALEFTTVNQIVWSLAKNADDTIPDIREWNDSFEEFPLDIVIPQVAETMGSFYMTKKKLNRLKAMLEKQGSVLTRSLSQGQTED